MNTELIVILDKSGSMSPLKDSTIEGFNTLLADQQGQEGDARITTVMFSSVGQDVTLHNAVDIKQAEAFNKNSFSCNGFTALRDCIGNTLSRARVRIEQEGWADKVVIVIMTDGGENNSRVWSKEELAQLIEELEENNWSFVYTGANQDSFAVASEMGMTNAVVSNYSATAEGTRSAYGALSVQVSSLRA